nr:hypothetical protein [Pirellula sp.]
MSPHPNTTPASPSLASPLTDAAFDSIELLTKSFAASEAPTFDTTAVIEVGLSFHRITQYTYLPGSNSLKSSVTVNGDETYYDDANHVIEVRTPRYFDSSDTEGFQKARETWTYNGRGLVATHTEATGSTIAATESFTYDLRNRQLSR